MDASIIRHSTELNRCNQRGGRMLSIFDLIEAGTLDLDLAAYLTARISRGASFMVGARPGGAGKTTVMCAMLNLVPVDVDLVAATATAVCAASRDDTSARRCYICHEIGSGPYFAYLWAAELRAYCALSEKGHLLATNLHADDIDEARDQVCDDNGVPAAHFNAFELLVFLRVKGGFYSQRRIVDTVYASDGAAPHTLVFDARHGLHREAVSGHNQHDTGWELQCRAFLAEAHDAGVRTIEETRHRVVAFLDTCK